MFKCLLLIALFVWACLLNGVARAHPPETQLMWNNDSVRVTLLTFHPGAGTGRHLASNPSWASFWKENSR